MYVHVLANIDKKSVQTCLERINIELNKQVYNSIDMNRQDYRLDYYTQKYEEREIFMKKNQGKRKAKFKLN